jgi:hypothetical protein
MLDPLQMDLGDGWSHVGGGGRVFKASTPTLKPISQTFTEVPKQPRVTATTKKAKPEKAEPKITAVPKAASVKPRKAAATGAKPVATAAPPVANPHPITSLLEGISDLIDKLPLDACEKLTRRLLTSIPSLPKGAAFPRAVLKTVIFYMDEYGSTPYEDGSG